MEKYLIVALVILGVSCTDREKYSDEEVCSIMATLHSDDQKYRALPKFIQYNLDFQQILDSINLKKNISKAQFDFLDKKEQNEIRKNAKTIVNERSTIDWDSLSDLQKKIDNKNTEILIDIIAHKGWPNRTRLNCEKSGPAVLIFRHAHEKYFDTIRKIIKKESKEKRMADGDYMFIDNHLKGRLPLFNFTTE